jgi:hypothetical protein
MNRKANASVMMFGSSCDFTSARLVHSRPPPAGPSTRSDAMCSKTVPSSASAMPTPHRMKYFHAASRLAAVR